MRRFMKYKNTFILAFQNAVEYRVDFLFSIISGLFMVIVQCSLWSAVFKSTDAYTVYGYTYHEMIIYSIFSGIVTKLVATGFEREIADDIKMGGLSKYLTQPVSYRMYCFQKFIGGKVIQILLVLGIMAIAMLYFCTQWTFQLQGYTVVAFLISILLGLLLNFCIFYMVSHLAFIMTEVWGVFIAVNQGSYLLSGGIFPLDVFGEKVYRVLHLLPFEYTVYFQVNIINGHLSQEEIAEGIFVQMAWILILGIAGTVTWRRGLKKYVAVGN